MPDPYVSVKNTTYTALSGAGTFTGTWEDVSKYVSVVVSCKADVGGTLYLEFTDNKNDSTADSTLTYTVDANINEVHKLTITAQWYRVRYVNGSSAQSSFKIQSLVGNHSMLTAPLNLSLGQDADAIPVRSIASEIDIAEGKRAGYSIINKFGRNTDVDTGTLPEDVNNGQDAYAGFPLGDDETITITSTSAEDTNTTGAGAWTMRIFGLDSNGDLQQEDVNLNGITGVTTSNTFTRVFRAIVLTSASSNTAFNVGAITLKHTTTTANIFAIMAANTNQTENTAYTIPNGCTGYLRYFNLDVNKANTAVVDGNVWVRESGKSPRLIRPFSASNTEGHQEQIYGGIPLPSLTDLTVRIVSSSASNVGVTSNLDILLVKN